MKNLVKKAIESFDEKEESGIKKLHEQAKTRIKEYFGEFAETDLVETGKPCEFRIKGTNWNLVYGFFSGFTLWHKDKNDDDYSDNRYNAWQIVDMASLGRSLKSVKEKWGLI